MNKLLLCALALTSCLPLGCTSTGQLTPKAACKLDAVASLLPADPDDVSVRTVMELARRVKECDRSPINREYPDGGAP